MATKGSKFLAKREVAKLVTENRQPCVFCNQDVDDEVIYGKLYSYGDIQCHYFCVLLSCCLVQKGRDSEGLFGFLYKDILAEVERSKKHKCSYCGRGGASLGCSVTSCRKQFHLPCGRRKNAVSLFYGNYKSFCELHAPKQKISQDVMQKAKERIKIERLIKAGKIPISSGVNKQDESTEDSAQVCVICYEEVQAYPTTQTFWPPCCGRDAWLHRACLQRMALSAGMHYLKCPLCNDKDNFYDAVCDQGYYLPDRDAAWELEQNAFSEIYDRDVKCAAPDCKCPFGRGHDELGMWDIKLCLLCGSWGMHAFCAGGERPVCVSCRPAANDIEQLETRLTEVIMAEQALERERTRSGPVMPSRMSLRRTKARAQPHSASSSSQKLPTNEAQTKTEPQSNSLDQNKAKPKLLTPNLKDLESKLLSPMKLLEQTFYEKGGAKDMVVSNEVVEKIRLKFSKPRPLSVKKKIVNKILDDLFKNVFKETHKNKEPIREWNSPKKSCDIAYDMNQAVKKNLKPLFNTIFKTGESEKNDENNKAAENVNENLAQDENTIKVNEENEFKHVDDNVNNLEKEKTDKLDDTSDKENDLNPNNSNLNVRDTENDYNDAKSDDDDESSRSTFQLPPEFVADSNDSFTISDSPKKPKNDDTKQDSNDKLNNEVVGTEKFIKILTVSKINNKESLDNNDISMDVDSNHDHELKETERDCNRNNSEQKERKEVEIVTCKKRKLKMKNGVSKKRKKEDKKRRKDKDGKKRKIKLKIKMVKLEKGGKRPKNIKMKELRKTLVKDKNVRVKIKLKDESKCKIKKIKKHKVKSYKQCVLKYSPIESNVIVKPEVDFTPIKRKYKKIEKSPSDNLVQTSIQSFFKVKTT